MHDLSLDDVAGALTVIDANDRDTWVQMGMAIKSAYGDAGFDTWDSWSQSAGNYEQAAARATWKSIRAGGGIGIASLVMRAKEAGHVFRAVELDKEEKARRRAEQQARRKELERQAQADEAERAQWYERNASICRAIDAHHLSDGGKSAYLQTKHIRPLGVRFARHSFIVVTRIDEQEISIVSGKDDIHAFFTRQKNGEIDRVTTSFRYVKYGTIAVPMRDVTGKLYAFQFISESGTKSFLKFARKSGLFHVISQDDDFPFKEPPPVIAIAEGYATGATIHLASGWPVVVAFDSGNLFSVAETFRTTYSQSRLVICGDDDYQTENNPGKVKAEKTALHVNGLALLPVYAEEIFDL